MAALITAPRLMAIGGGALAELPDLLGRLGLARPLVVSDPYIAGSGILDRATALLDGAGIAWSVFSDTVPDPTTAGTGSEVTRFTVVTDTETDEKMLIAGLACCPSAAIVDFELTLSMPLRLTADTGIDSLTHAIEAYVSRRASPFTDGLAKNAMGLIARNIRAACAEPQNRAAREAMMLGATKAGMAFSNASVALVHGMSRPIGAFFHVPHGLSNAMLLPEVTAFSVPAALERYADCARAMGVAEEGEGSQGAVARLLDELRRLNEDLKVPTPRSWGIDAERYEELLPVMASQALASGSPANNPRIPTSDEIIALYRRVYG